MSNTSAIQTSFQRHSLSALSLLDQPVWVFDIVRRQMFYANEAAVELWGAQNETELLSRNFADDMSDATLLRLDGYLQQFAQHHTLQEQWTMYPCGEVVTVDCVLKGIHIEEGRLAMLVVATKGEASIHTRHSEMLRQLPVAACLVSLDGVILEQNPECLSVFGRGDDFLKRFVDGSEGRRIMSDASDNSQCTALQHTALGQQYSALNIRRTRDAITSEPVLLCTAKDVTELVMKKRRNSLSLPRRNSKSPPRQSLPRQNSLKALSTTAHAMRTPLQHILTVVELLQQQKENENDKKEDEIINLSLQQKESEKNSIDDNNISSEDAKKKEASTVEKPKKSSTDYLSLLLSSAQMLMSIIEKFTQAVDDVSVGSNDSKKKQKELLGDEIQPPSWSSHGDSKRQSISTRSKSFPGRHANNIKAPLDLRQIVHAAIQAQDTKLPVRTIAISRSIDSKNSDNTVQILGDSNMLWMALTMLLEEAASIMKSNTEAYLSIGIKRLSSTTSGKCRIKFEFKVHNRGGDDNDVTTGDSIERCKALVQEMGGELTVNDNDSSSNLWASMEIPFEYNKTRSSSSLSRRKKKGRSRDGSPPLETVVDEESGGGMKILLVDEDGPGRSSMSNLLEQLGHTVTAVESGDGMVQAVINGSFDAVLLETADLDHKYAESNMTTMEASIHLRNSGYHMEQLPLIALTTAAPPPDYQDTFNDWLTKPVLVKDIQKAITNAICNMGRTVHSGGSLGSTTLPDDSTICTSPSLFEKLNDNSNSTGPRDSVPSPKMQDMSPKMPRRGSFGSSFG